jgi:hypothetical protein
MFLCRILAPYFTGNTVWRESGLPLTMQLRFVCQPDPAEQFQSTETQLKKTCDENI